ncbi:MAG: sigma-70 family RNA polymerase sigma factor [Brachymonas sp.]|nr:sigma-70 family RNA polymerase sigma factor [Brachymonas sp.]NJS36141.1 sigma-70 family RNA polymerase sigma factor [Brachymonas sp.]
MTTTTHDEQLMIWLEGIAQQDANALRQLYDATSRKLFAIAMRVVGNVEHAEDVLQESFLTIWRVAGDYRAPLSPPMVWLGVIVRSRGLDFLRRRASERALAGQPIDDMLAETLPDDGDTPMQLQEASEQAWALHECLRQIEPKQRQVVTMAYYRDLSHSELAEQLKLPLGTVKSWMRRSLEQLRICMNRFA